LNAVCLLVAGTLRATLPTDVFTVAWDHSVEKTRWEEDYRVEAAHTDAARIDALRLVAVESRVEGFGAGMEPAPGASLRQGVWRWRPALPPLPELRLTVSPYTADYRICWNGGCQPLHTLAGGDAIEVVTVAPCAV
jgi:hypothetical protein